ncbi:histidine kinase [Olivibacter sp. SDN3]|nr:histidine kinase [Olivibacter sp. SDN3]
MLASFQASGTHYYFKHYQVDDGLLHNNVTSIIQDKLGFIWVGTRGGLNRFDGHNFKHHIIPSNNSGANYIRIVREDNDGFIWVGTQMGLFKFDPVSESFRQFNLLPFLNIRDLKIDSKNNLWIIANANLYKYDQSSSKLLAFDLSLTAFDIDNEGNIWLATIAGDIKKLDAQHHQTSDIPLASNEPFKHRAVTQIRHFGNNLLIGTMRGLFAYDSRTKTTTNILSRNEYGADIYVREIHTDGTTHYIATESGVFIYDVATNHTTHLKKIPGDSYSLNDNATYTVFADKNAGVWVGTFFGGLNYFSQEAGYFEKYYPLNTAGSISGNAVREICGDSSGNIWIGTEDAGINKLDVSTGKFTHINHQDPNTGLSYPNIHGLLVEGNHLLAGPFIHGFEVMDFRTGKVIDRHPWIRSEKNDISGMVMSIFKTADQRILVGTTGAGLHEYRLDLRSLSQIKPIPGNSFVYAIAEDHHGTIWTGSLYNGAFYFNPKTGEHGNISFNKVTDTVKNYYTVQGIYEDNQKSLWFATEGGGLVKLDSTRKLTKRFTTDEGFPTNNIYRVLEDDFGNLWISSLKGLICFNILTEKFHVYTKSNGLITDQFNYNSAYKDKNGKMYFGTVKGMIAFVPEDLLIKKKSPPPTYITKIQINNKDILPGDSSSLLKKSMLFTDSIVLNHRQASFNIEFAALDFSSPEVVKYKYRLEGLEKEWTYLSANRKAYFTGLPAGVYHFVVQAESNVGYWTGEEQHLTITVLPPFWKSLPAYLLYAVLVILLVSLAAYVYHQGIKRKNQRRLQLFELEKEREVYQAKIEFFTNIAHEIQTPLTLIKGPVEWALSQINDTDTVQRNLRLVEKNTDRLVALTTQLLDFRKMEIDQFGLNFVLLDINQILLNCVNNFRSQIEKKQLKLKLLLPDPHLKAPVDQEAFIKIVSNLLSNAVKYGNHHLAIRLFTVTGDSFKISITNDGEPIPPMYRKKIFEPFFRIPSHFALKGTGIGLSLAKSLAELHGGHLEIMEHAEQLTVFELTLPLDQQIAFQLNVKENLNDHERNIIDN